MIKEQAIKYRKVGWQVIPLYNQSKMPTLNWKELQTRMSTDEEFNGWFDDPKVTGLGVITGKISGIVVVDEDSYKADGMKFEFESPMIVQTARGGKHHYFKYIEPIKTSGFRQGVNIEIKSDGGFIVLPPSVVVTYPSVGDTGTYTWLKQCAISKLPTITEAQLLPYRGSLSKSGAVELHEMISAPYGTQHNNLRTIALATFNRFNEKEWDIAADFVRHAAAQFDPPHPETRVEKMIKDVQDFILINPKEARLEEAKNMKKKEWNPLSVNEIAEERIADRALERAAPTTGWPELDVLIKGFIPGHTYTLTGDTNVGKTTLGCNFAINIQRQGKRTLYIALEPDVNVVEYLASCRLQKRFDELTEDDLREKENIGLVRIFLGRDMETAEDLVDAVEQMERFDLVIIDHIGYFVHSEKDWIQQQANIIKQLAKLAKSKKCAMMIIAHLRKPSTQKKPQDAQNEMDKYGWIPTQNDIAGAAAFKQDSTEVMIAVRKYVPTDAFSITFADEGALLVTKTKTGPNGSLPLIFSEKSALVMSVKAIDGLVIEKAKYEAKKEQEQQMRIGEGKDDPWDEKDETSD